MSDPMPEERFRLSPPQAHLWALTRKHGGLSRPALLWLERPSWPGPGPAEQALRELRGELEILRTTFGEDADGPWQAPEGLEMDFREGEVPATLAEAVSRVCGAGQATSLQVRWQAGADGGCRILLWLPALCSDAEGLAHLARAWMQRLDGHGPEGEPVQYVDVAEWQHEILEAEDSRPGRDFWKGQEHANTRGVRIPFQEQPERPGTPAVCEVTLAPETWEALKDLCLSHGATLADGVGASFGALLGRLARQDEVVLGHHAAGRHHEELEDTIGLLARRLPVTLHPGAEHTFTQVLQEYVAERDRVERWQDCLAPPPGRRWSFGVEVRDEEPSRSVGSGFDSLSFHDLVDCRLDVRRRDRSWAARLIHDTGALSPVTAARLAEQWTSFVTDAVRRPAAPLADLDLLGASERQRLLVELNATAADYPRDVLVHQQIEEQARNHPEAVAVEYRGEALTYGELDSRANRLAHELVARGVRPDTLVGLCVHRSTDMVVAIVAILKAGGAYVPLDPAYPRERLAFLVEDTQTPVILTERSLVDELPASGATRLLLDEEWPRIAAHPDTPPETGVAPHHLVYVIYTSGSTGKPKGVVITHEKLQISNTARVHWFGQVPRRFLLLSSFAFDSSVVGIFWSLCGGGTLHLIAEEVQQDLASIPRVIADAEVSHLLTLPSFYHLILDHSSPEQLAGLDTVIVAGEACPKKMVDRHRQMLPGVRLFSEYGATETTVFSSVYDCLQQTLPIAPVGHPIENAEMYILDEQLRPLPTGIPGEVHFGGPALAVGYWRRPELTAERFVPDPFSGRPGARLYKSGDLARHLEQGDIEFLGRLDNQVKIRGYRIELEEIEVALGRHPNVKEVVVLALAGDDGDKRLVGYLVPVQAPAPTVGELREFLKDALPEFMVPGVFVVLDDMPRTPNGKVDRKNLPAPGAERPELDGEYVAPCNPTEETLAAIWAEVLRLDRVGTRDNFFELGGDSILSIQIVSRANQAGLHLSARHLFLHQTVQELAAVAGQDTTPRTAAEQGPVTGPLVLTPIQHWFFDLGLPEPAHWNMPVLLAPSRPLDEAHLRDALGALLAHHDGLRLRRTGPRSLALAAPQEPPPLEVVELAPGDAADQAGQREAHAAGVQRSLDLEQGPLVRMVWYRGGPGREDRLLWVVHHLAVDGVSWRILLEDLQKALEQRAAGEPIVLPPKTTSLRQWGEALPRVLESEDFRDDQEHWLRMAEATPAPLPLDHPDGRNDEASARRIRASLTEAETRTLLSEAPKAYQTQINDVLLAALTQALGRWTGQRRVRLNLEGHGREEIAPGLDLSRTVGWFTTDYPVDLTVGPAEDLGRALLTVKEELRALPHQGMGFGLWRHLGPADDTRRALEAMPRPQVGFNYLGQFDQVFAEDALLRLVDEPMGPSMSPAGPRVFPLEVYGQVQGGRLELDFEYSANLHEAGTIQVLADDFLETLRRILAHCTSQETSDLRTAEFADFQWSAGDLAGIADAIQKSRKDPSG